MKFLSWIIALPLIALCVAFAVSNRHDISLDLWPLGYVLSAPLYLISLGFGLLGFFLGALVFWLRALPPRMQRRRLAHQVEKLKAELDQEKAKNIAPLPPAA